MFSLFLEVSNRDPFITLHVDTKDTNWPRNKYRNSTIFTVLQLSMLIPINDLMPNIPEGAI